MRCSKLVLGLSTVLIALAGTTASAASFSTDQALISSDAAANTSSTISAAQAIERQNADQAAQQATSNIAAQDYANAPSWYSTYQGDASQAAYQQQLAAQQQAAAAAASTPALASQYQAQADQAAAAAAADTSSANDAYDAYQAWNDAGNGATAVSTQQGDLANQQQALSQTDQAEQTSSFSSGLSDAQTVGTDAGNQASSTGGQAAQDSLASVAQQTGVPQGQVSGSISTDLGYVAAGAALQTAMSGMAESEASANIAAVQDAQAAASCGNPYCSAAFWAMNAAEQSTANGLYAAGMAAAPTLAVVQDAAAVKAGADNMQQVASAISSQTGVQQGVPANFASQAAFTAPINVPSDTSYTSVADGYNAQQTAADQANIAAGIADEQAGQNAASAKAIIDASNTISTQDTAAAQTAPSVDAQQAWLGAAANADAVAQQNSGVYTAQEAQQQQDIATENATDATAMSTASPTSTSLNASANTAGTNAYNVVAQQIQSATGVAQQPAN